MNKIDNYNDFVFESITNDIFRINESEEPYTFKWDFKEEPTKVKYKRLKDFLSKLPKDKILRFLIKFLEKLKFLSEINRRRVLMNVSGIFLTLLSVSYINSGFNNLDPEIIEMKEELVEMSTKSSFEKSQEFVSVIEGGYSNDRTDTGNYIKLKNGLRRFVGSKFGISAPILKDYLGKLPTKEDMKNLSYESALEIYKNKYWDKQNIENFHNQSVATTIYDACVNQGIGGAKSIIRNALNDNGISIDTNTNPFSQEVIDTANSLDQQELFNSIQKHREERYKKARTWEQHGRGWIKRISNLQFE